MICMWNAFESNANDSCLVQLNNRRRTRRKMWQTIRFELVKYTVVIMFSLSV